MVGGIINILLGVVGIGMGLNGRVLAFTHSTEALIVMGGGLVALGTWQIWRNRRAT